MHELVHPHYMGDRLTPDPGCHHNRRASFLIQRRYSLSSTSRYLEFSLPVLFRLLAWSRISLRTYKILYNFNFVVSAIAGMSVAFLPTIHSSRLACHCYKGSHRIHDVFPRSTAFRRTVLHCFEPSVGGHCSSWSNMPSIESFTGRKDTSALCCRGMMHAHPRHHKAELSEFAVSTTRRRDSSCSCREYHVQTSTSFYLRQEKCSLKCLSLLGSYTRTCEHLPISTGCHMLTRR
jgi:hypothetical protein